MAKKPTRKDEIRKALAEQAAIDAVPLAQTGVRVATRNLQIAVASMVFGILSTLLAAASLIGIEKLGEILQSRPAHVAVPPSFQPSPTFNVLAGVPKLRRADSSPWLEVPGIRSWWIESDAPIQAVSRDIRQTRTMQVAGVLHPDTQHSVTLYRRVDGGFGSGPSGGGGFDSGGGGESGGGDSGGGGSGDGGGDGCGCGSGGNIDENLPHWHQRHSGPQSN